jgi:hypothetical protein
MVSPITIIKVWLKLNCQLFSAKFFFVLCGLAEFWTRRGVDIISLFLSPSWKLCEGVAGFFSAVAEKRGCYELRALIQLIAGAYLSCRLLALIWKRSNA